METQELTPSADSKNTLKDESVIDPDPRDAQSIGLRKITNADGETQTIVTLVDITGDGIPDRFVYSSKESLSLRERGGVGCFDDANLEDAYDLNWRTRLYFTSCTMCMKAETKESRMKAMKRFAVLANEQGIQDMAPTDYVRGIRMFNYLNDKHEKQVQQNQENSRSNMSYSSSSSDIEYATHQSGNSFSFLKKSKSHLRLDHNVDVKIVKPERIRYFHSLLQHATSIYGALLNTGFVSAGNLVVKDVIKSMTGIKEEHFLLFHSTNEILKPAHYVAVDHEIGKIIVCVRGTSNINDCITDVIAVPEPFLSANMKNATTGNSIPLIGKAHGGIRDSALNIFDAILPVLNAAVDEHPHYEVVVTGHSLGAGTGSILTILLRDIGINASGVVFAPPPCLTNPIALKCAGFVTSIVNNNDLVTRLSLRSLREVIEAIKVTKEMNFAQKRAFDLGCGCFLSKNEYMERVFAPSNIVSEEDMLMLPGTVAHIVEKRGSWYMVERSPKVFENINWRPNLMVEHMPISYHSRFKKVLQHVKSVIGTKAV